MQLCPKVVKHPVYGELVRIQQLAVNVCEFGAVRQPDQPPTISQAVPTRWRDWGGTNYWGIAAQGPTALYMFLSFSMVSLFFDCTN